jgi:hypothetical protein
VQVVWEQIRRRLELDCPGHFLELPRWAVPDAEVSGAPDQRHVRMFAISHLCGPFIGLALSAFLFLLEFPADVRLGGFSVLVCLFWVYPVALALGARYRLLSLLSLQHLLLVVFWASHGYGGLTSPFLLWLAVVPLLASLYGARSSPLAGAAGRVSDRDGFVRPCPAVRVRADSDRRGCTTLACAAVTPLRVSLRLDDGHLLRRGANVPE